MLAVFVPFLFALGATADQIEKSDTGGNSGITKVVHLLKDLAKKCGEERHAEETAYAAFNGWCEETTTTLKSGIDRMAETIAQQTGVMEENNAKAAAAGEKIEEDNHNIKQTTGEIDANKAKRAAAKKEYLVLKADYELSIDALARAIDVLNQQPTKVGQKSPEEEKKFLFAQIEASGMKREQKDLVTMLVQQPATPQGHAYESSGGGIIGIMEDLEAQFTKELREAQTAESNAAGNSALFVQNKKGMKRGLEASRDDQETRKALAEKASGDAKGEIERNNASKGTEEGSLRDVKQMCHRRSEEFARRQATRNEELAAIAEAEQTILGISNKDSMRDRADAANKAENTEKVEASFLQVSRRDNGATSGESLIQRVTVNLKNAGRQMKSKELQLLALHLEEMEPESGAFKERVKNPMQKVLQMVQDLINKLKEEHLQEQGKFGRCEKDMATNKANLAASDERIATLSAEIKEADSAAIEAQAALKALAESDQQASKDLNDAQTARSESSQVNDVTVRDAKEAVDAIETAIGILTKFYEKAGQSTALLQLSQPEAPKTTEIVVPDTWTEPYQGDGGASGGIIGMMETVQGDMMRLITETETEEIGEKQAHEKFINKQEIAAAEREAETETQTRRMADAQAASAEKNEANEQEKVNNQGLLDEKKVIEVDQGCKLQAGKSANEVFEEVQQLRMAEINSLKDALDVLTESNNVSVN